MKKIIALILIFPLLALPIKANSLSVSARSAVVINGDNAEIVFEKDAHKRMPMASTTKIMTGLLLCEYGNLEREITVTADMIKVEGSSMGLLAGDRVTLYDLLYGLLLASGNDAANVIATIVGGSVDGFVKLMNKKASEMGLKDTSFQTPSGLDGENHYTTAYELALITKTALENEEFAKAVSTKKAVLNYGNPPYRRSLTNHNKLLSADDDFIGVKTGFTKKSGRCLVSAKKTDGKFVICVTLNAPDDWNDHKALSSYGISAIKQIAFIPEKEKYFVKVIGANALVTVELPSFYVNTAKDEEIKFKINLPQFVYAPVKKGEKIGSIEYLQNGESIGSRAILSKNDVNFDDKQSFLQRFFTVLYSVIGNI